MLDPQEFYVEVGRLVRKAREQLRLNQEDLASRVHLARTSITNIEKGRQRLLLHTLVELAAALRVSPADLLPENAAAPETGLDDVLKNLANEEKAWIKATVQAKRRRRRL